MTHSLYSCSGNTGEPALTPGHSIPLLTAAHSSLRTAPSAPGLRSKRERNSQGKMAPKPTESKGQNRELMLRNRDACPGQCLKPHPSRSTAGCSDKRWKHSTAFPQTPRAFSPARGHRELVTYLQIVHGPKARDTRVTLAAGTRDRNKVLGGVQRGRSDFHKELRDSTKHCTV